MCMVASDAAEVPRGSGELRGARLLLVDDDALARATLALGLGRHGYHIAQAASASEALAICEAESFDLALVDIRMPGESGIDLAHALRDRYSAPLVFLSAFSDPETLRDAARTGALGYLVKPLELAQIVPEIETAIARAAVERAQREREDHLNVALTTSRETSIAIGILMARERIDRSRAFEILRRRARDQRRKLHQVAAEVVDAAERLAFVMPPARPDQPAAGDSPNVK